MANADNILCPYGTWRCFGHHVSTNIPSLRDKTLLPISCPYGTKPITPHFTFHIDNHFPLKKERANHVDQKEIKESAKFKTQSSKQENAECRMQNVKFKVQSGGEVE